MKTKRAHTLWAPFLEKAIECASFGPLFRFIKSFRTQSIKFFDIPNSMLFAAAPSQTY
jgi:hypothetical protein